MRIISGKFKNKKLFFPLNIKTRPLKESVRENIFNILEHSKFISTKIEGSLVLDLYAGTGSFGLECISRGAEKVIFFENYLTSTKILKKNLDLLKLNKYSKIIAKDIYNISQVNLNYKKFDLIFLDPPFKDNKINLLIKIIKNMRITSKKSMIIIHRNKKIVEDISKDLIISKEKSYGLSKIIFGKIY